MELTVPRDEFAKALGRAKDAAATKASQMVLTHALLEAQDNELSITATDMDARISLLTTAKVTQPGQVCAPAKRLQQIVKDLPDPAVHLKLLDSGHLAITSGAVKLELVALDAADYPEGPQVDDLPLLELPGSALATALDLTGYAVSPEGTRFNLNSLYLHPHQAAGDWSLRFVATDGHRLCLTERPAPRLEETGLNPGAMIPAKGLSLLRKLAEAEDLVLRVSGKWLSARSGTVHLIIRCVDSLAYPDYTTVIPEPKAFALVNRTALAQALSRARHLASDRFQGVKLVFGQGVLSVEADHPDIGKTSETLEVDWDGGEMSIGLNARFLLDACEALAAEEISLGLIDDTHPLLITSPADPGFTGVIMPMRI